MADGQTGLADNFEAGRIAVLAAGDAFVPKRREIAQERGVCFGRNMVSNPIAGKKAQIA
jgi:hypothetical protein